VRYPGDTGSVHGPVFQRSNVPGSRITESLHKPRKCRGRRSNSRRQNKASKRREKEEGHGVRIGYVEELGILQELNSLLDEEDWSVEVEWHPSGEEEFVFQSADESFQKGSTKAGMLRYADDEKGGTTNHRERRWSGIAGFEIDEKEWDEHESNDNAARPQNKWESVVDQYADLMNVGSEQSEEEGGSEQSEEEGGTEWEIHGAGVSLFDITHLSDEGEFWDEVHGEWDADKNYERQWVQQDEYTLDEHIADFFRVGSEEEYESEGGGWAAEVTAAFEGCTMTSKDNFVARMGVAGTDNDECKDIIDLASDGTSWMVKHEGDEKIVSGKQTGQGLQNACGKKRRLQREGKHAVAH
jgi:hypothetical protein